MCGIAGFNWQDERLVEKMTQVLLHRGPDDEGHFVNADVSFGHRRLSILDLSELGRQPMLYESGSRKATVTYNGEIYNYREIRRELENKGYRFITGTDTEVIPAAYLEWGLGCVEKFNGMWAFALYDGANRQIIFSRDRFGEKPLYYYLKDGRLIFASEIKAILEHPVRRQANTQVVSDYLFKGAANHGLDSFFEDIQMLPPAHNAVFDLRAGTLKLHKYYDIHIGERRVSQDEFLETFRRSVHRRLLSDVPISVSLSSGVDSTSVAALAAETTKEKIKAFTTASEREIGDETVLLSHFLRQYPQFEMEKAHLSEKSFCDNYRHIIYHMDEPFVRQSAYVRWEIASLTGRHGWKVLLNGEGADEILGGYFFFTPLFFKHLLKHFMLIRFAHELYATALHPERNKIYNAFRSSYSAGERQLIQAIASAEQKQKKFQIGLKPIHPQSTRPGSIKGYLSGLVCESSLPRLLNCNDKMTMANSVEGRAPFLDHEFVDMAFSMDPRDFIVNGRRKFPLRQAMRGKVPDSILFRKTKDAFHAPIFDYLRNETMQVRVREVFSDARTESILSPMAYLEEYDRFLSRRGADRSFLLHGLFLEEWSRMFKVQFN